MQRLIYALAIAWVALTAVSCGEDENYVVSGEKVNNTSNARGNSSFKVPLNIAGLSNIGKGNVNPQHGQPGHRCDIAVGAPLNTNPELTSLGVPQNMPLDPVAESILPAPDAPNPAHGKPGHRCDIAVGAPLNSKPQSPTPATTVQQPSAQAPALTSAVPEVVTPPGMNPPHGKPGHRCDIAVGAPLKQAK